MLDPPFTPVPPRIAAPADAAEIVRVVNLAYLVEAEMFHGERTTLTDVRERLGRPHAAFLVIDADPSDATSGSLVGAVYVEIKDRHVLSGEANLAKLRRSTAQEFLYDFDRIEAYAKSEETVYARPSTERSVKDVVL